MPFLDASALDTDPAGMAFLRGVLGPVPDEAERARRLAAGGLAAGEVTPPAHAPAVLDERPPEARRGAALAPLGAA